MTHECCRSTGKQGRPCIPEGRIAPGLASWRRRSASWSRSSRPGNSLVTEASLPYFSRPTLVAAKLFELLSQPAIYRHISVTLSEIAIGYALGAGFGLSLGFILGRSQFLSAAAAALHHRPLQHPQDRARARLHRLARTGDGIEGRSRIPGELLPRLLQYLFRTACDQRGAGPARAADGSHVAAGRSGG